MNATESLEWLLMVAAVVLSVAAAIWAVRRTPDIKYDEDEEE